MIEGVIFDMDGLLIDSEPHWRMAEIEVFRSKGIQLTEADCRRTTGMRIDEVVQYWMNKYPQITIDLRQTCIEILDEVSNRVRNYGEALPGVYEVIKNLKKKKLPLALASGSNYSLIEVVLEKLKLKSEFVKIQSAENLKLGKPHPEIFLKTAEKMKVNPINCLVFEDSFFGVLAAKSAKMKVIAVPDSENYTNENYCIADNKIDSLLHFDEKMFNKMNN